jgi:hypothetical protein
MSPDEAFVSSRRLKEQVDSVPVVGCLIAFFRISVRLVRRSLLDQTCDRGHWILSTLYTEVYTGKKENQVNKGFLSAFC